MIQRLIHIVIKEFRQLRSNPEIIRIILFIPIVQIMIFGYAAVLDIKNIDTAYVDKDRSNLSRELIDDFKNTSYFKIKGRVNRERDLSYLLDRERIFLGIVIPPDFSKDIRARRTAQVQLLIDGTNSTAAGIIASYGAGTVSSYSNKLLRERGLDLRKTGSIALEQRFLYNPSLDNKYFFLPGIFAMIVMVIGMPMTARSIVREKEMGTLEQLIVTPISPLELIIGKVIPFTILILLSSVIIIALLIFWFHLPMRGSLAVLFLATLLFLVNCFGIGIFISSISATQQQAMLSSFFVNLPMILFSGFIFPVDNMPTFFQYLTKVNPMLYFLNCARGITLKGSGLSELSKDLGMMAILGFLIFTISALSFKKRMD